MSFTERWVGVGLVIGALILSIFSLLRMLILRNAASKYLLFPTINMLLILAEINTLVQIFVIMHLDDPKITMITKTINDLLYLLSKPIILYLAYERCRAVFQPYQKFPWAHYAFFFIRIAQIFSVLVGDIIYIIRCDYDMKDTDLSILKKIRDGYAPIPRIYYIFNGSKEEKKILNYRRLQAISFVIDLLLLSAMIIYRLINTFEIVPTYDYADVFCTAFTVFNMTQFGVTIPKLFKSRQTIQVKSSNSNSEKSKSYLHLDDDNRAPRTSTTPQSPDRLFVRNSNTDIDKKNEQVFSIQVSVHDVITTTQSFDYHQQGYANPFNQVTVNAEKF
ncbi:13032_t:CDS:2 [Ambispora leptoticha]|uniref:13032_t:CDS:1 n=1 Tax=Ambispora leptoticha TaxID=144679 RepID=A0A9N8ZGV7_9GLOM|nr:13032_t:CDS:2 [Ambispora leptoticha]